LKIQDGCDAWCSYCIIPQARPKVHSKPPDKVLAEANALVASGHKEIVLTGVHVGAYGCASVRRRQQTPRPGANLPDLLEKVARIRGLARLRVSSLDPADVTPRLLDVFASHRNIMPHLHLSLQSGSDVVLARMCRPYTADDFRAKVELIRNRLDRPAITTDIIVGFPGETQADFDRTRALAEEVAFSKIHVFAFSPRQGTAAAKMQNRVPTQVTKQRSQILRDLDLDLQRRFRDRFIGETAQVLVETANGSPAGRAERYFMVRVVACPDETKRPHNNSLVNVTITENAPDAVLATLS
jgi:threonylcarbamoyladenosine tRNA methylthiotransferase MtaB